MKDKNVAGFLALFFGWMGFHRFYLGQVGLGIIFFLLSFSGISVVMGIVDALAFFFMDKDKFNLKYNRKYYDEMRQRRDTDYVRRKRGETDFNRGARAERRAERESSRRERRGFGPRQTRRSPSGAKANPYKQSGKDKYKDFDYQGAIEDFKKSLEIQPVDPAVHFNLACAYSLEENVDQSFYHLEQAVATGFKDFKLIKEHDALAFLRIQSSFDAFVENNYKVAVKSEPKEPLKADEVKQEDDLLSTTPDLLDQIKKLGDLRDKGLLTEDEFVDQKKKLLG
ncbi:MAG: NINE protein [Saprospiraceae bacterium]|nr:NINE protein [Saprospiraceae bacterium]